MVEVSTSQQLSAMAAERAARQHAAGSHMPRAPAASVSASAEFEALAGLIGDQRREVDAEMRAMRSTFDPINRRIDDVHKIVVGIARQRTPKPPQPRPTDVLVKAITARFIAVAQKMEPLAVAAHMFGDASPALVMVRDGVGKWWTERAVTNPAQTTVAGWAADLVNTARLNALASLAPSSGYAQLSARAGLRLDFTGLGAVSVSRRVGTPTGSFFVGEGSPIPVRSQNYGTTNFAPKKGGFVCLLSKELSKHSSAETIIRQSMSEDATLEIDAALFDASAASAIRPAGLLNGAVVVPPVTAGSALDNLAADVAALFAALPPPLVDPVVICNPVDAASMLILAPGIAGQVITTGALPVGQLVALDCSDFATGEGLPDFTVSEEAVVHQETAPLPIATGAAGAAVVAAPTVSLFQSALIGIKVLADISFGMRLPNSVSTMTLP